MQTHFDQKNNDLFLLFIRIAFGGMFKVCKAQIKYKTCIYRIILQLLICYILRVEAGGNQPYVVWEPER